MSSREQFEAWIAGTTNSDLHRGIMLDRHENGRYRHLATENKWEAWQEATKQSEAKCAALAAENAALKAAFDKPQAYLSWHAIPPTWEDPLPCGEYLDVHDEGGHKNSDGTDCWPVFAKPEIETPGTDTFLAEVRAQGADECVRQLVISDDDDFSDAPNMCAMVAHQLRKGVQS